LHLEGGSLLEAAIGLFDEIFLDGKAVKNITKQVLLSSADAVGNLAPTGTGPQK
jgi:hypothetical protein